MKKIGVILQPSFLPWLGFFDQLLKSDVFVYYDNAQYTKNDWRNRNRIKSNSGYAWLTVPVKYKFGKLINEVEIAYSTDWRKSHLSLLKHYYGKAPFFNIGINLIQAVYDTKPVRIIDLNTALVSAVLDLLQVDKEIKYMSNLNVSGERSEKLVKACSSLEVNHYLSGAAAKNYLDVEQFQAEGIHVEFQNYRHPIYRQINGGFLSHLSVIDLIFNEGHGSGKHFKEAADGRC